MLIKRREFLKTMTGAALAALAVPPALVYADKSAVRLEAPQTGVQGDEITITVHVTHNGNNFFHYTNEVYILADGDEIGRWEFSSGQRPESENFSREVTLTLQGATELVAEANCNLHGSAGKTMHTINLE